MAHLFFVLLFWAALGASEADMPVTISEKATTEASESSSSMLFRVLGSLSIIGLGATGAFWWIRKQQRPPSEKSSRLKIRLVSQFFLAPKKSLAVIQVAGETMLLGISDQNINMIKSLALLDEDENEISSSPPSSFKKALDESSSIDEKELLEIQDVVSTRLKGLKELK